ncbi:MAG TPA: hypothetical protein VMS01_19070 [Stellaceae bacterium]|nr:hypothetical protein [Stellaceae bacterium]
MADEAGGVAAAGAAGGLFGGNAETDCACAVAAIPASNPTPKTVDLSKLFMAGSPIVD